MFQALMADLRSYDRPAGALAVEVVRLMWSAPESQVGAQPRPCEYVTFTQVGRLTSSERAVNTAEKKRTLARYPMDHRQGRGWCLIRFLAAPFPSLRPQSSGRRSMRVVTCVMSTDVESWGPRRNGAIIVEVEAQRRRCLGSGWSMPMCRPHSACCGPMTTC